MQCRSLATSRPGDLSDEQLVQGARDEDHLRIMRMVGLRSAMVVPIATGERTLDAITFVTGETDRNYDEQDLAMAEEIGRRAGVAIENARLYEAEREARKTAQLAEERRAAIQLISDAALAHLEVRACDGIERESWKDMAVPCGASLAGDIVAEARPFVVEDVAASNVVSWVIKDRLRSLAGVPLMGDGEPLGVLHIGSFETRRFTDADIELLRMVAARISLALDRANAHDALRLAEQKLRLALEAAAWACGSRPSRRAGSPGHRRWKPSTVSHPVLSTGLSKPSRGMSTPMISRLC